MKKKPINLGFHRGNTRIWMEGYWLKELGFHVGARYDILEWGSDSGLTLRIKADGKRKVSGKGDKPIIDINNKLITRYFNTDYHEKVLVSSGYYPEYQDINIQAIGTTKCEFATERGYNKPHIDAALPQDWLNEQYKNPDFPGSGQFLWDCEEHKPLSVTPIGDRYLEGLVKANAPDYWAQCLEWEWQDIQEAIK